MLPRLLVSSGALAAALLGCAQPSPRPEAAPPGAAAAPSPLPGALSRTLRRADAAFARSVADRDEPAFRAFLEEEAVFVGGTGLLQGREAVFARWKRLLQKDGPTLRWAPTGGDGAASGDLGWTVGSSHFEGKDAAGRPVVDDRRYLTVWRRAAAGSWLVAMDMELSPPAEHEPMHRTPVRSLASADGSLEAVIGTWSHDGVKGPRRGAYLTVRERSGATWRVVHDSATAFPP